MRTWPRILILGGLLAISGLFSSSAVARPAGYCLECHPSGHLQSLKNSVPAWDRSVYQGHLDPCPGIRSLAEESFFTESRILKIAEILEGIGRKGWATDPLKKKAFEAAESFYHLKRGEIASVSKFSGESSVARSSLQKVYDQSLQARAELDKRWLIGVGVLSFIGVMILPGIGFRKLSRVGKALLMLLLLWAGGALSACSSGPIEPVKKSPAQDKLDQALSVAVQASSRVEEGYSQSILLAQMAQEWSQIDPQGSDQAFQLAWKMAQKNQEEAGRLRSFQEIILQWPDRTEAKRKRVNYDTILELGDEVRNAVGRTWALRAVAEEWLQANEEKGRFALELASQKALEIEDPEVRDRELKPIAEVWARIDEIRAWKISRSMGDRFLKSLTLKNIALTTRNEDRAGMLLREAWKTSQSISSPYLQCRAFARISAAGAKVLPRERNFWADQMAAEVQKLKNPQLQRAVMQDVVYAWALVDGDHAENWAISFPPEFSEGRAYSFFLLSQRPGIPRAQMITWFKKALAEADRIQDPFEVQKIKRLVAKGWIKVDPQEAGRLIAKIEDPYYRSEMLEELSEQLSRQDSPKALEVAERIPIQRLRTKMVVKILGQKMKADQERVQLILQHALQAAQSIPDPQARAFSLIELAKDWGPREKEGETVPLELALRAADQVPSPPAKAEILEMLAAAWKNSDPAKGKAVLERIDPSVASIRRSLAEIRLWAKTDPLMAQSWADAIPPSFPYEKALALKEVAVSLKKSQPRAALGVLDRGLRQALTVPEGSKQSKLLSELIAEAALLDKESTLRKLRELPEGRMRDLLFKEAGAAWLKEEPLRALKAAREISEGSLRLPLYQKIAEAASQKLGRAEKEGDPPLLFSALVSWGLGREKAKREELQVLPFFEKVREEVEKVTDPLEKSYLLGALAVEWAPVDEQKALRVTEKISSKEFSEPYSYALLRVGIQYRKWNRKEADSVFQKTLLATGNLGDASLRAQRLLQLGQEWGGVNREKGKEVLAQAAREARSIIPSEKGEPILGQILQVQVAWEPENSLAISRTAGSGSLQAKVLMEGAKILGGKSFEEDIKVLERALQSAQKEKNSRLMSEVAAAWYPLAPQKALEILGQIEGKEICVGVLRQMARSNAGKLRGEAKRLLDQATDEALAVDGLAQKIQLLKEIGHDWLGIDKERAKATFLKAYQILEKEYRTSPKF